MPARLPDANLPAVRPVRSASSARACPARMGAPALSGNSPRATEPGKPRIHVTDIDYVTAAVAERS
jgi:hypothetical protein